MKIFLTGGTGTIGSAVVAELLANGHSVLGLARSDAAASALRAAGAAPVRGELRDLDVLRRAAAESDGVIQLAFDHDFAARDALARAIDVEGAALGALGDALIGSGRPLITVSGTPWVPGRAATELDPLPLVGPVAGRAEAVNRTLALAGQGVRAAAVRMPRTVHAEGRGGFAGLLTDAARRSGIAGYPSNGDQRWPAVHARDAAALFRLVLEQATPGTSWHAVADEGDAVIDIATVIGRRLGVPVAQVPEDSFGEFGPIFAMDQPASSAHTRATLGWEPAHPALLADLELIEP